MVLFNCKINKDMLYITAVKSVCIACSNFSIIQINRLIDVFLRSILEKFGNVREMIDALEYSRLKLD